MRFTVDQDITPDWFEIEKEKYEEDFRKAVKEWWEVHVVVDQEIDELTEGYYRLKRCEVKRLCKEVQAMLNNSTVQEMYDNSTVQEMYDNSIARDFHSGVIRVASNTLLDVVRN